MNNYQPTQQSEGEDVPEPWPTAYAYTGTETDGGTVMECTKAVITAKKWILG